MIRPRHRSALTGIASAIVVVAAVGSGLTRPAPVLAAGPVRVTVSIEAPATATIGSEVVMRSSLKRSDRLSAGDLQISLYVNGRFVSSQRTDAGGNVAFRLAGARTAAAGRLGIEARFDGRGGLSPGRAETTIDLRPARIEVVTVPPVPGIGIAIGDQKATTDVDGKATVSIDRIGRYAVKPLLDALTSESVRVSFVRWGDSVFSLARTIDVRGDATYRLGLRIAYRGSLHFVDLDGNPVDPHLITHARLTASNGSELVLTSFDDVWWDAGTAVSRTAGLQASTTLWRLAEVQMAGTNVVNQGQQAFTPTIGGSWTVRLLLYNLSVRTEDAVFGAPMEGSLALEFPDGTSRSVGLGADGTASFSGLPRGQYTLRLTARGIVPPTPIALSRSQEAAIRVISYLDLGVGAALGLMALVGLIWVGRRHHIAPLFGGSRRRVRAASTYLLSGRRGLGRGIGGAVELIRGLPSDLSTVAGALARTPIAVGQRVADSPPDRGRSPGPRAQHALRRLTRWAPTRDAASPAEDRVDGADTAPAVAPALPSTPVEVVADQASDRADPADLPTEAPGSRGTNGSQPDWSTARTHPTSGPANPGQSRTRRHACPQCGRPTGNSKLLCRRCRKRQK